MSAPLPTHLGRFEPNGGCDRVQRPCGEVVVRRADDRRFEAIVRLSGFLT